MKITVGKSRRGGSFIGVLGKAVPILSGVMCGFGSAGTVIPAVSAVTGAVSDKSGTSRANSGIDTSTVNRLGKRNKPIPTQRLIITTVHTIPAFRGKASAEQFKKQQQKKYNRRH